MLRDPSRPQIFLVCEVSGSKDELVSALDVYAVLKAPGVSAWRKTEAFVGNPDFLDALLRGTPRRGGAVPGACVWRAPLRDNTGSAEVCLDIFPVTYSVCSPTVGLRRLIVGVDVSASPHALP